MEKNLIFKRGFWEVEGTKFTDKYSALYSASQKLSSIQFNFNNGIWESFDLATLGGKNSLNDLYKQRACQLRDRYSYLILYYSGGADSHNILRTFIDNDIKLDEICVKWPKPLRDGKFYTPNCFNTGPENFWSEWNYSIVPVLEWLASNTNIKINLVDPIENYQLRDTEQILSAIDHDRNPGAILINNYTDDGRHNCGHIYGIDKPLLCIKNSSICMFFSDFPFTTMTKNIELVDSTECFYWSPDFPELPIEMAFKCARYFKDNPELLVYLKWDDPVECTQFQNDVAKRICYTTWDFRFQACKPKDSGRNDKFKWMNSEPEMQQVKNAFVNSINDKKQGISTHFLKDNLIRNFNTRAFPILNLQ